MFPEELPMRLIKMFSFVGETILDPFLGSGTTTIVAKKLNRNSIGYEINKNYLSVIRQKIGIGKKSLFEKECKFEIIHQLPHKFSTPKDDINQSEIKKTIINNRINGSEYWKTLKTRGNKI